MAEGFECGAFGALGGIPKGELTVISGMPGTARSAIVRELVVHALATDAVAVDYCEFRDRREVALEKLLAARMSLAGDGEDEARSFLDSSRLEVITTDGATWPWVWGTLVDRLDLYPDCSEALVIVDDIELIEQETVECMLANLLSFAHDEGATITVVVTTSLEPDRLGVAPTKVISSSSSGGALVRLEVVRDEGVGSSSLGLYAELDPLGRTMAVPRGTYLDDGLSPTSAREAMGHMLARAVDVALGVPIRSAALASILGFEPREGSVTIVAARGDDGCSLRLAGRIALEAEGDASLVLASSRGRLAAMEGLTWAATGIAPRDLRLAVGRRSPLIAGEIRRSSAYVAGIDAAVGVAQQARTVAQGSRVAVLELELAEIPRDVASLSSPNAAVIVVVPCHGNGHEAAIRDRAVLADAFLSIWDTE